jgi:hypothetical protein
VDEFSDQSEIGDGLAETESVEETFTETEELPESEPTAEGSALETGDTTSDALTVANGGGTPLDDPPDQPDMDDGLAGTESVGETSTATEELPESEPTAEGSTLDTGETPLAEDWSDALATCCTPPAGVEEFVAPGADTYGPLATDAEPLTWTHPDGREIPVSGLDLTESGSTDFVPLSVYREDGRPDAWLMDLSGQGVANLFLFDNEGNGIPTHRSFDPGGDGAWSDPEPNPAAAAFVVGGVDPSLFGIQDNSGSGTFVVGGVVPDGVDALTETGSGTIEVGGVIPPG